MNIGEVVTCFIVALEVTLSADEVDTHNGVGVYFFHRTIRRMYGNGKVQFSEKHMGNGYTVGVLTVSVYV